jgi:hypothetical protein
MTKPPLHSIDSLFQERLEELPVDLSQQQEQWLSLHKAMNKPPKGLQSQLNNPMAKLFYMTVVALVPFGVFYFSNQQTPADKAAHFTGTSVTQSLLVLNKASRPVSSGTPSVNKQASVQKPVKQVKPTSITASYEEVAKELETLRPQPEKSEDSTRTAPVKQEKPVIKKADSTYIYWQ